MRIRAVFLISVAAIPLIAAPIEARETLRDRMRARMVQKLEAPSAAGAVEKDYGSDPLQKLDFWKAKAPGAPLVIFVHGGGWKRGDKGNATGADKVTHWQGQGYAVASINYRLVPANTVEQQAQDVADAVAWLRGHAADLGFDPGRIVLAGHSAGAHLVALVGTDARYLEQAGLRLSDVRGVMPIDGAAYDVATQMKEAGAMMGKTFTQAFGADPERQRALSPTAHAAAPNAPAFLILHVQREDGLRQARVLAEALQKVGTLVTIEGFPGTGLKGHMEINRALGQPDYPATPVVDLWLAQRFAVD